MKLRTLAYLTGVAAALLATAAAAQPAAKPGTLGPVDYAFIGQTHLGNPYQTNSGRIGVTHAASPKVVAYAKLMIPSHIEVQQKLDAILARKGITPPPTTLLEHSYDAMLAVLKDEKGEAFDREYVRQQMNYQTGNDALYRWEIANGKDPDLLAFAKMVLPKIDDHFDKVKALQAEK